MVWWFAKELETRRLLIKLRHCHVIDQIYGSREGVCPIRRWDQSLVEKCQASFDYVFIFFRKIYFKKLILLLEN